MRIYYWLFAAMAGSSDAGPGGSLNAWLMEDGVSGVLMEDGTSDILMESV